MTNDPAARAAPRAGPRAELDTGARTLARRFAVQALYRLQINEGPWQDALLELDTEPDMARTDRDYLRAIVEGAWPQREALDQRLAAWVDRRPAELDPVEHAILLAAVWELIERPDVPRRVVADQAVIVARRFGATDGHKFVNAVVDRAARELRPHEQ